jgi:hypothetical protein
VTTSLAFTVDDLLTPDRKNRFWIIACWTKNEFSNEAIQNVLQLVRIMLSVDNVTIVLQVKIGLRSKFTTKIFCWI